VARVIGYTCRQMDKLINRKHKMVRLDEEVHRELKILCAQLDRRISDAVAEAVRQWLEKQRHQEQTK